MGGGTGGLNYLWSSGETTPILSGLSTGSYTLSVNIQVITITYSNPNK